MKFSLGRFFLAVCLFFVIVPVHSVEVLKSSQRTPLDAHLSYYEDVNAELTFDEVVALYEKGEMTKNTNKILNFGFSESVFWVRASFKFSRSLNLDENWVVSLDYAPLEKVELFILEGGGTQHIVSGTSLPFNARPVLHRNLLYPIKNYGESEYELWLRVKSDSSIQIPLSLWTAEKYFEHETLGSYGWGVFFGILMALGLYNLFLFVSVKDTAYLYYVLYLVGLSGVVLFLNGQGAQYIWNHYEQWNQYALLTFTCFAVFWALQFSRTFLETRQAIPRFDMVIVGMMGLALIGVIVGFMGWDINFPRLAGTLAALFAVILMIAGIKVLKNGNPIAPYFLIAWSFFLGGILVYLASVFGISPTNMFTESAIQFGSAAEAILLSLGLAKRIKIERKLKYEALESKHHTILKWQRAEKKLLERASYDALTSLPNSTLLYKCIEELKNEPSGAIKSFGLVIIHFNRFHEINKTLGKRNGDLLLMRAADRLAYEAGRIDHVLPVDRTDDYFHFISVLDGINFCVLVEMSTDVNAPHSVAEKLLEVMKKPIEHEGLFIDIDAIAGMSLYPVHGEELDSLVQHATIALESSNKSSQKISTYSPELNYYSTRRLSLMGDLLKAIESNTLELFLQPQVDLSSANVIGAEALIRWEHDQHGFVRPDEFIPLAEQSGLIRPLTAWVIDKVLQYDKRFQSLGYDIQLSINISAKNIAEANLVKNTLDKLIEYHASPKRIVFEMTETTMMDNPEKALSVLNDLSDLGVQLSIDDFGTGYSSLSYLNQLPVNELKIDRSFVTDMIQNPQNQKIVAMTVNLAHTLGLKVVAEGIEDRDTMLQLQKLGCDVAQGYFIARPMPETAFLNWLEKQSEAKIESISRVSK